MDADAEPAGGDSFRRAVAWLLEQPVPAPGAIEEASARFGLTPLESAVLFRYFSGRDTGQ